MINRSVKRVFKGTCSQNLIRFQQVRYQCPRDLNLFLMYTFVSGSKTHFLQSSIYQTVSKFLYVSSFIDKIEVFSILSIMFNYEFYGTTI